MSASRDRAATLDTVAKRAGVSRATASRVLNGGVRTATSISTEIRESIFRAAEELDYAVNTAAQAMVGATSRTIAILVSEVDDPGSTAILAGAMRGANENGFALIIGLAGFTAAEEIDVVRAFRGQRPFALIVAVSRSTDPERERAFRAELDAFADEGGSVVIIGTNDFDFDEVTLDNYRAGFAMAEEFVSCGYSRVAVVTGTDDLITPTERSRGFIAGLAAAGRGPVAVVQSDFDRAGGHCAAGELLSAATLPDAVFATSDAMALGVLARLREHGLDVPGDIAIAGFDDVPILRDVAPALTTVRVPLEALAEKAVALLIEPQARPRHVQLSGEIVVRESTPRRR